MFAFVARGMLVTMTTILVLNAISSLLAAVGIGGFLLREWRRMRKVVVRPAYVARQKAV